MDGHKKQKSNIQMVEIAALPHGVGWYGGIWHNVQTHHMPFCGILRERIFDKKNVDSLGIRDYIATKTAIG